MLRDTLERAIFTCIHPAKNVVRTFITAQEVLPKDGRHAPSRRFPS